MSRWQKYFPIFNKLNLFEKEEIKISLEQALARLLIRAWNEICRIFLDYLKTSPSSPLKNLSSLFARHEF